MRQGKPSKINHHSREFTIKWQYIYRFLDIFVTESSEDVFRAEDLRLDLIDPEALEEIRNGRWTCKQLRELILHMVLPRTAFIGN